MPANPTNRAKTAQPVVLVVGMINSVHTARWLDMVRGRGMRFVLLPVIDAAPCRELVGLPEVRSRSELDALPENQVAVFPLAAVEPARVAGLDAYLGYSPWLPSFLDSGELLARPAHVAQAIASLRPSIVHALETQFAGYLCMEVKRFLGAAMPTWMLSSWGSDFYLYRKVPDQIDRLREIAGSVDAYMADGERDVTLFREFGFKGMTFPAMPASGGVNIDALPRLENLAPPSQRREIMVKGLHGWSGRALNILNAIHLAAPELRGFSISLLNAPAVVAETARTLGEWDDLRIACLPSLPTYRDVIMRMGRARTIIGLGISDGTPTVMLEAMSVGAFPIQSDTSAATEWLVSGETGFIVSPHDIAGLAERIVRAATDDALVDGCVERNRRLVEERWNQETNAVLAANAYRAVLVAFCDRTVTGSHDNMGGFP